MGYDFDASPDDLITTHAQALDFHNGFTLGGGVDVAEKIRQRFTEKFGKPAFSNHCDALNELQPDIAVISVPTEFHLTVLEDILHVHTPKLLLVEKPLSYHSSEVNQIFEIANTSNSPIAVNYFREYEPVYRNVLSKIEDGFIGFPLKVMVHYTKGIVNNGSHFIRYISNFMEDFIDLKIIEKGRSWAEEDPEPDIQIKFDQGLAYFIAHKEEDYSYYEMEMIGPKGKLRFSNLGSVIEHWDIIDDPDFEDYRILSEKPSIYKPDFNKYQEYVYNNIYNYLQGEDSLYCDINSMDQTLKIYESLEKELMVV
jgi:predicted dehydrogenase